MNRGFSLVELSIVLVILGLLTGGILAGQSLIRAAELRSISSDSQRFQSAVHTFRDKYFAMPGDMANATKFWTAQDSGDGLGTDCTDTPSTTQATCNGDGDGRIDYDNATNAPYESWRNWQHLANAGLIEGQYNGIAVGSYAGYSAGVNVPRSRINNGVWGLWYVSAAEGTGWLAVPDRHYVALGSATGISVTRWHNGVIKPEEAWNVDTKMDDGKPFTGRLLDMAGPGAAYYPNCTDSNVYATANYNLTATGNECMALIAVE